MYLIARLIFKYDNKFDDIHIAYYYNKTIGYSLLDRNSVILNFSMDIG